jgi:hypothetical protein
LYYCCNTSFFANCTQSGKEKKASLAIEAPCKSNQSFCFSTACTKASTLDVLPVPDAINVPFFCKNQFDLFLQTFRSKD